MNVIFLSYFMPIHYLLYFLKSKKQSERKLLIDAIENATHISWPILPETHQKSAVIFIQELKKHDFYESLNLLERLILLKIIINNIFCHDVLEYAIDHLPDIEFEEEKKILKRRIDILKIY